MCWIKGFGIRVSLKSVQKEFIQVITQKLANVRFVCICDQSQMLIKGMMSRTSHLWKNIYRKPSFCLITEILCQWNKAWSTWSMMYSWNTLDSMLINLLLIELWTIKCMQSFLECNPFKISSFCKQYLSNFICKGVLSSIFFDL